jgi:hypothetical protein
VIIVGKYLNLAIFDRKCLFNFRFISFSCDNLKKIFWAITQCKVCSDVSEKRPASVFKVKIWYR